MVKLCTIGSIKRLALHSGGHMEVTGLLMSDIAGMLVPPKDLLTLLGISDHQLKRAQESMSAPSATHEQFGC